jgi:glycosyltransferase involved in cell wall biosynthesis
MSRLSRYDNLREYLRPWFRFARTGVCPILEDLDDAEVLQKWKMIFERERNTPKYRSVFRKHDPLVSVCITTSDQAALFAERALATMKQQTYKNLEVIVVGDRCDDDTEATVAALGDPRYKFFNLPMRGPYPRPGIHRWMVAGTNAFNFALRRVTGDFVTHLDEDDTLEPRRIEILVNAIQNSEADLIFHPFFQQNDDRSWKTIGNGTFKLGQVGGGMTFYHHWLARIPWDVNAFRLKEPGDWNRLRKIEALGATLHYVDQVLASHWRFPRRSFVAKPGETFLD